MRFTLLSIFLVAGCWREATPTKPAPAPAPVIANRHVGRATDDVAMCHVWVARSRGLLENAAPGVIDWDDLDLGCRSVKPEELPFIRCVFDAEDDPGVERCWDTYFKLDVDPARALGH